jgi:hypothetical protein
MFNSTKLRGIIDEYISCHGFLEKLAEFLFFLNSTLGGRRGKRLQEKIKGCDKYRLGSMGELGYNKRARTGSEKVKTRLWDKARHTRSRQG